MACRLTLSWQSFWLWKPDEGRTQLKKTKDRRPKWGNTPPARPVFWHPYRPALPCSENPRTGLVRRDCAFPRAEDPPLTSSCATQPTQQSPAALIRAHRDADVLISPPPPRHPGRAHLPETFSTSPSSPCSSVSRPRSLSISSSSAARRDLPAFPLWDCLTATHSVESPVGRGTHRAPSSETRRTR